MSGFDDDDGGFQIDLEDDNKHVKTGVPEEENEDVTPLEEEVVVDSQAESLVSQKLQVPFPMERTQHKGLVVVKRSPARKLTTLSLFKASWSSVSPSNPSSRHHHTPKKHEAFGAEKINESDDERDNVYGSLPPFPDLGEGSCFKTRSEVFSAKNLSGLRNSTLVTAESTHSKIRNADEDDEDEVDEVGSVKNQLKTEEETATKKRRASVLLLYTGGTIGMRKDAETGAYFPDAEYLADRLVHGLLPRDAAMPNLSFSAYTPPLDSSDMNCVHWAAIAEAIGEEYDKYDGFVVITGTDTMAYTASALSFALENLGKPVVVTGSQIPISVIRSDGVANLVDSCLVAAHAGKDLPECVIVFDGMIMRANRTTKLKAWGISAFKSFSYPLLGEGGVRFVTFPNRALHPPVPAPAFRCSPHFSPDVALFSIYPGVERFAPQVLNSLRAQHVRGIVMEAFGTGNTPSEKALISTLDSLCHVHNIVVCVVSRCPHGAVSLGTYSGGYCLAQAGCTSCHDMTVEAAFTKLSWLLGDPSLSVDRVRELMEEDLRGEVTQGLFIHSNRNHNVIV